jgi:alpha-galactosidase
MKKLGDYIHDKGLLYGIYNSAGTKTCEGRAGSLYYEMQDALLWASYGVDYLKYDNCYNDGLAGFNEEPDIFGNLGRYIMMERALNATGRKIFYSICQWGDEDSHRSGMGKKYGNSFRTTYDISNNFGSVKKLFL